MKKLITFCGIFLFSCWLVMAQDNQESAIIQTALDYADGFYSGDAARLESALHPDFNKVLVYKLPQSEKTFLQYSSLSGLLEYTKTNAGFVEEEKRKITVTVLGVDGDVASAKLTSAFFNDFLQLVNFDGEWKIVNVLWSAGPDTPNLPPAAVLDPELEKEPIMATLNDYYDGIYSGDVEKLEKVIHPEVSIAQLRTIPQTGKYAISRSGAGFMIELTRAGYMKVPEDKRDIKIELLDIMNKMAFVRVLTEKATSCFQLQLIDKQWTIINILSVPPGN